MNRTLRPLLALCLAFLLGFAQQAAAWHALGHAIDGLDREEQPANPADDCPQHSLFASFADGTPSGETAAGVACAAPPRAAKPAPESALVAPRFRFDSRAPPHAPHRD